MLAVDLEAILRSAGRPVRRSELVRVYQTWLARHAESESTPDAVAPSDDVDGFSRRLEDDVRRWWQARPLREQAWLSARGFGEPGPPHNKQVAAQRIVDWRAQQPDLERARLRLDLTPQRWGQLEREVLERLRAAFDATEYEAACRLLADLIPKWGDFRRPTPGSASVPEESGDGRAASAPPATDVAGKECA